MRITGINGYEARSIEAKMKFVKRKKCANIKGTYIEKWKKVIKPLMDPYPDSILSEEVTSLHELEV